MLSLSRMRIRFRMKNHALRQSRFSALHTFTLDKPCNTKRGVFSLRSLSQTPLIHRNHVIGYESSEWFASITCVCVCCTRIHSVFRLMHVFLPSLVCTCITQRDAIKRQRIQFSFFLILSGASCMTAQVSLPRELNANLMKLNDTYSVCIRTHTYTIVWEHNASQDVKPFPIN